MADLFRTRDHVPDFDTYVARYASDSAAARATLRCQLDLAYGTGPDERLDLFFPAQQRVSAPVHLFVHGGYWRMFGKDEFSFIAKTVTAAGAIAAVMDYSLMPSVRMETIVGQVHRAVQWLATNAERFGGDGTRLSVSGHSAGAHLCALLLGDTNPVRLAGTMLVSGIYDLAPLQHSFLQPELALSDEEVARFSPMRTTFKSEQKLQIVVGEHETEPFHAQAQAFGSMAGVVPVSLQGGNHMSVVLDMGNPQTQAGRALVSVCV